MFGAEGSVGGLEVAGHLSFLADNTPLRVEFHGKSIDVIFPNIRAVFDLRSRLSRVDRRVRARSLQSLLMKLGFEVRVWVRGHKVGVLTAGSRSRWLARCLAVDPLELKISAIAACLAGWGQFSFDGGGIDGVSRA